MNFNKTLLATFCSASLFAASAISAEDSLTIGISQYPATLHPAIDSAVAKMYIRGFTQRDSIGFDQNWQLTCFLCEQVPTFENGLATIIERPNAKQGESQQGIKMTMRLKKDLFWGDGTPVTSQDIVFWFQVATSSDVQGNPELSTIKQIEKLDIIDDYTVDMYIDRITYEYNSTLRPKVLPRHLEEPIFKANPKEYHLKTKYVTEQTNPGLYNGPYIIEQAKQGQFVKLASNPYWKGKAPHFDKITLKTITDTQALQANLLSGDIDYIPGELGLTLDQALQLDKRYGNKFNVDIRPAALYEHLDLQLNNSHLSDVRVRQALLYGLDRELLTKKLFEGKQPVASSSVSPLDATFSPNALSYSYDPEKAKQLLKQAGYKLVDGVQVKDGQSLALEFMTTAGNKTRELVQQFAQGQWKKVGIKVVINNQPARVYFGTTLNERKHKGLAMFAWSSSPESLPNTTLHSDYIPTQENGWAGQNYAGYSSAKMDDLIDKIEAEVNTEKRKALWKSLQNLYATELPALPLFYRSESYIYPKWLTGVEPTGHQYYSSFWAENWARAN
ncbi:peptide ABC transporter substrate-binding protein [Vibrio pectenicida]|uniref:Peptide ABC transporter substrate-binding protein n=1 Tax=Vibrio pectenicida TaxID=62763 RepID=A0A7Y3ZXS5_9VIBR|nr:peptide ABC transporter substrate-binding protein [Vibrio pectenicida]NOH70404.1 peptide ABC transporter substrate-binding protein [Vibrio pectenicida]